MPGTSNVVRVRGKEIVHFDSELAGSYRREMWSVMKSETKIYVQATSL